MISAAISSASPADIAVDLPQQLSACIGVAMINAGSRTEEKAASDDSVPGCSATEVPGSLCMITFRRVQVEPKVSR
jgi:hypothetical protein